LSTRSNPFGNQNKAAEYRTAGQRAKPGYNFTIVMEVFWIEKAAGLLYKTFLSFDWKG
jgi:hypothetical protein